MRLEERIVHDVAAVQVHGDIVLNNSGPDLANTVRSLLEQDRRRIVLRRRHQAAQCHQTPERSLPTPRRRQPALSARVLHRSFPLQPLKLPICRFSARNAVTARLVKASLRYQIRESSDNIRRLA